MNTLKKTLKLLGIDSRVLGLLYKGTTISRCKGMDQRLLEGVYALGHQYYENKNFEMASKIFRYLCIHNHTEPRYMEALGASEYQRGEYVSAQHILENITGSDQKNPKPLFNLAMSLIAQKKHDEATDALLNVISLSKNNTAYQREYQSAEFLLSNSNREELS